MAEDKYESGNVAAPHWMPWTLLFRGFQVAIDPKKLLLAAAGILLMAAGWWVLAWIFDSAWTEPNWKSGKYKPESDTPEAKAAAWAAFKEEREKWNLLYQAAGAGGKQDDANDQANSIEEFDSINAEIEKDPRVRRDKPYGKLRTWPFFEDRGPNPYLLVTGQKGHPGAEGAAALVPWERGHFLEWFVTRQMPVLVEPLDKLIRPIVYLLHPNAGFWNRTYFLLVLLWTLLVWGLFGGAITRMAAVELTRKEKIGPVDALRFTWARYLSYFSAPLIPLAVVAFLLIVLFLYGLVSLIPAVGDIWDGISWIFPLLAGLVMAMLLIGLVGWPMMYATISTEGSDSFDAISRAYNYVFQCPWQFIWYSLVALAYGAVLIFFVGFMGSLTVYLAKLGVSQPSVLATSRDPSYLFIKAPTSFGWRDLLLQGSEYSRYVDRATDEVNLAALPDRLKLQPWNWVRIFLISVYLYVVFLMVIGFGYSFFWSASTIIYLLLRRKVDDTELDEVYLEEDEVEEPSSVLATSASAPASAGGSPGLTMVEPPTLRPPSVPPGAPATAPASTPVGEGAVAAPAAPASADRPAGGAPANGGDGTSPTGGGSL
jgi:hypothetical protein